MTHTEPSRTALVVDGDAGFRYLLQHLLQPWQLEIVNASSVAEARALAEKRRFDLYLIDLQLTDGDSASLLSQLAALGTATAASCVVVTSFPTIAPAFSDFPVVDKTRLASIGKHLLRILGMPRTMAGGEEGSA